MAGDRWLRAKDGGGPWAVGGRRRSCPPPPTFGRRLLLYFAATATHHPGPVTHGGPSMPEHAPCQIRLMGCCVERSKEGGGDRRSTPGDMSATQHLIGLIPRQCERMVYLCGLPKLSAPRSAANTASGASAIRLCPLAIVTTLAFSATPKSRDALGGVI